MNTFFSVITKLAHQSSNLHLFLANWNVQHRIHFPKEFLLPSSSPMSFSPEPPEKVFRKAKLRSIRTISPARALCLIKDRFLPPMDVKSEFYYCCIALRDFYISKCICYISILGRGWHKNFTKRRWNTGLAFLKKKLIISKNLKSFQLQ